MHRQYPGCESPVMDNSGSPSVFAASLFFFIVKFPRKKSVNRKHRWGESQQHYGVCCQIVSEKPQRNRYMTPIPMVLCFSGKPSGICWLWVRNFPYSFQGRKHLPHSMEKLRKYQIVKSHGISLWSVPFVAGFSIERRGVYAPAWNC